MKKPTKYLVIRHGSNAANQPMRARQPLCIVEAAVVQYYTLYNNQRLEIIAASKASNKDWMSAQEGNGFYGTIEELRRLIQKDNEAALREAREAYEYCKAEDEAYYAACAKEAQ